MAKTRKRRDHRPAILNLLRAKGPRMLYQIIAYLKADDAHDAVEWDLRALRKAGVIRTVKRKWELVA